MSVNENGVSITVGTPGPEQGILISTISARNAALDAVDELNGLARVAVQQTRPEGNGPFMWWKTDENGIIIDLIVADGVA